MMQDSSYFRSYNGYQIESQKEKTFRIENIKPNQTQLPLLYNFDRFKFFCLYQTELFVVFPETNFKITLKHQEGKLVVGCDEKIRANYEVNVMRFGNQGSLFNQEMQGLPIEINLNEESFVFTPQAFLNLIGKQVKLFSYKDNKYMDSGLVVPTGGDFLPIPHAGLSAYSAQKDNYIYMEILPKERDFEFVIASNHETSLKVSFASLTFEINSFEEIGGNQRAIYFYRNVLKLKRENQLLRGGRWEVRRGEEVLEGIWGLKDPNYSELLTLKFNARQGPFKKKMQLDYLSYGMLVFFTLFFVIYYCKFERGRRREESSDESK